MALDKLVDSTLLDADLTSVANAIRTKGGTSASLAFPADFLSAIAAIPSGGGGSQYKSGTYTPATTPEQNENVEITTIATIGFTPKLFMLYPSDMSDVSGTQYAVIYCVFFDGIPIRLCTRYTNTSNAVGTNTTNSSWTTQSGNYLYLDNDKVYYRNVNSFTLIGGVEYTWGAIG